MADVEIRFEREELEGIVPVGTYLNDGAKRFGVHFDEPCQTDAGIHFCAVAVTTGADLLSSETNAEEEFFKLNGRRTNERLACQAKIENPGEIVIMTKEKVKEEPAVAPEGLGDENEQYRKAFAELPLDKKIANLVQLESIALGETVAYVINSPFKVADLLMGVMAEFGFRKEEQQKSAVRPEEHAANGEPTEEKKKGSKGKSKREA